MFSAFDSGNFFVVPGSPAPALEAESVKALNESNTRPDQSVIAIVGSQFTYQGLWLEHALVLEALSSLKDDFPSRDEFTSSLKIIILSGNSMSNYSAAVEVYFHVGEDFIMA